MDIKRFKKEHNVPWISENGEFDYTKYPIDHPIKDAFSFVEQKFISACKVLGHMAQENRIDAGIFLIGLIVYYKEDFERRNILLESIKYFKNNLCSTFLFEEIMNADANFESKSYIDSIIEILRHFPQEMVKEKFVELSTDEKFDIEIRNKFLNIIGTFANRSVPKNKNGELN